DVQCARDKEQRSNFRCIVQSAGKAHGSCAQKMCCVDRPGGTNAKAFACISLIARPNLVDCDRQRRHRLRGENVRWLRQSQTLLFCPTANANFFANAQPQTEKPKDDVNNSTDSDGENRTE